MTTCHGKKEYRNFHHAAYDAKDIRRKHDREVRVPFKCRHCGFWHVGEPMNRDEGLKRRRIVMT
jgi:predicted Zn-ribbon and HTH transcriptional regulator